MDITEMGIAHFTLCSGLRFFCEWGRAWAYLDLWNPGLSLVPGLKGSSNDPESLPLGTL